MTHRSRTRRLSITGAAIVFSMVVLAACDDDGEGTAAPASTASTNAPEPTEPSGSPSTAPAVTATEATEATEPEFRTIEHAGGSTDVPADPQNVLALDEYTALIMWELGVEPTTVYRSLLTEYTEPIASAQGVEMIEHALASPAIEASAALAPDLVVSFAHPTTVEMYDVWSEVGPIVLYDDSAPWQEQNAVVGEALGAEDIAAERTAALEAEIARVAAEIDAAYDTPPTVSIIGNVTGFGPLALPDNTSASAALLDELGLERPDAQRADVDPALPFIFFSEETLLDHDADFVFNLSDGGFYGNGISDMDLAPSLTGTTTDVSGEFWFASFPFAVSWMLADLKAALLGDGDIRTGSDALDHWNDYTSEQ
ncbi:MAG: ABC transporter substrate-binding protein [Actinomycetota bacterium]